VHEVCEVEAHFETVLIVVGVILLMLGGVFERFSPGSLLVSILSLLGCGLVILATALIIYKTLYTTYDLSQHYVDTRIKYSFSTCGYAFLGGEINGEAFEVVEEAL
jgi:hypothetical protein